MHCRSFAVFGTLLLLGAATQAASVQTHAGQTLTGAVDITPAGVTVTPAGAAPVTVALGDVATLTMADAAPDAPAATHDPALPDGWQQMDVGRVSFPGNAAFANDVFTLHGSGWGLWGSQDSAHLVMRPWMGDGIFTAHIAAVPTDANPFTAGIVLRQGTAADAPEVCCMLHPSSPPHLSARFAGAGKIANNSGTKPFTWLRLVRSGDDFTGLCSLDGQAWTTINTFKMKMTDPLVAGLAVAAIGDEELMTAQFDHVTLQPGARFASEGIGLTDGSVIIGHVTGFDAKTVHYTVGEKDQTVLADHVAYVFTRPLVTPVEQIDPSGKPSAVLQSGDIIEGTVGKLYAGRLHMDSLVFGPQDLDFATVAFVELHPVSATGTIVLTTRAGAVYCGGQLTAGDHAVSITTDALGTVTIPAADLWSIKQSGQAGAGK